MKFTKKSETGFAPHLDISRKLALVSGESETSNFRTIQPDSQDRCGSKFEQSEHLKAHVSSLLQSNFTVGTCTCTLVYNNPMIAIIVALLMQVPAVLYDEFNQTQHSVFITKLYMFYNCEIKTHFFPNLSSPCER